MTTICTSCGVLIPSSVSIYKCRQCVNHFVCQLCETKGHNRASVAFHTLEKILLPHVQPPTTAASSIASSKFANGLQQSQTKTSSIFNSENYLYSLLGYCAHCRRVVTVDKEESFQCQQCPNDFGVCGQCMPLMGTYHPSVHTFSKQPLSHWAKIVHGLYHLGITCDGCSREGFNGKRYQCEECPPSYDLCENCFGKKHTHHRLKYIQNPLLHSVNQLSLGQRTLELAKINAGNNTNWRDPLTGWTKSDAELVIQRANQEKDNYEKRLQQILKKNEEYAEEQARRSREQLADAQRRLQDTIDDGHRQMQWSMILH